METEHQETFDALKQVLVMVPVLGYPGFFREFILDMDILLKELEAIFPQHGDDSKSYVIAYASISSCPSEKSIENNSYCQVRNVGFEMDGKLKIHDYLLD